MQVRWRPRNDMELLIQLIQIFVLQKGVRGLQRADLLQPQCLHESILKDSMTTLHTALCLSAVSKDQFDVQRLHCATKLRQW